MATLNGTDGNDWLIGNAGINDTLNGYRGDDYLDGLGGIDELLGGDGNDTLVYQTSSWLNGGNGYDTLLFNSGGSFYDFSWNSFITGIEIMDLTGTGANSLALNRDAVIRISDSDTIRIIGNSDDSISIDGSFGSGPYWQYAFTTTIGGVNYDRYRVNSATLDVQQGVVMIGYSNNATIGNPTATTVTEDGKLSSGYLQASGSIAVSDLNLSQAGFQTTVGTLASNLGSLVLAQNGGYTYSVLNAAVQYLGVGQIKSDTFAITSIDGTTKQVSFNITGRDDAPVFGGTSTATVTEDSGLYTVGGLLTISDPDQGQSSFVPKAALGSNGYGNFSLASDGSWQYVANNSLAAVQSLRAGQPVTDYFSAAPFFGASSKAVNVTIFGVNDIPVVEGVSTGTVVEDATSPNLSTSGALTIADVDAGESSFIAQTNVAGGNYFGTFALTASGAWTYTAANSQSAIQRLGAGQSLTDYFAARSFDGSASKFVTVTIAGNNDVAVIGGASTGTVAEDGASPYLSTSGALTITDIDAGQSSFATQIRVAGSNQYGSFTLYPTGYWAYSAVNSQTAIQQLGAGQSLTDSFTALSSDGSASKVVTVTINGTNDVPVIGGVSTGTVVEDAASPNLSTSGALTIADVDAGQSSFVAQTNVAGSTRCGSFTLATNGNWTYTAANSQTVVQELGAGQYVYDYFTARSSDGSASKVVIVFINGANDIAVIGGVSTATVAEDASSPNLSAKGALTIADVDGGQSYFVAATNVAGSNHYGTFAVTPGGAWTYAASNSQTAIQQLGAGQSLTDSFTAISSDYSASRVVTVTITGTNDVPVIGGVSTATVVEDAASPNLFTSGALTIADVDVGQSSFAPQTNVAGDNGYGTFAVAPNGAWTYAASSSQAVVQQLGAGQSITDSFTVRSSDGSASKVVTVTIAGTNDVLVIGGVSTASVAEDSGGVNLSAKGALVIADVDAGQSSFVAQSNVAGSNHYGTFGIAASGAWTYTASNSQTAIQQLGAGQSITDSFTALSSDGSASRVVTVTIIGTNDVPVIGGVSTATMVEDAASPTLSTSGALSIADVDGNQSSFMAQTTVAGSNHYGTFALTASGAWTYTASNTQTAVQQLGAGQSLTDSFTARSSDGSASKVVTVTIAGTNDVPTIAGVSTATVAEDAAAPNLVAGGTLTIADVDAGQSVFKPATVAGSSQYGTFTLVKSGAWTYTAVNSQAAIQQLAAGQSLTDAFTAVSSDGTASKLVTVTINGTNDVAVIGGVSTAGVVEDASSPTLSVSGALTIADADAGQSSFTAQAGVAGSNGYGSFTLATNGAWTYSADDSQSVIQQLGANQSLTDAFTARSSDGSASQVVTVTISGANDQPVISGVSASTVIEDTAGPILSASGALTIVDPDAGQSSFVAQASTAGSNGYGSFTLAADGAWTYSAANSQTAIQQLGAGQSLTDSFTALSSDGVATQVVTVTIMGVNDAPTIAGVGTATMAEDSATPDLSASGALTIADVDAGQSSFVAQASVAGNNQYGSFTLAANGAWTYTAVNSQAAIQQLAAGQSLTDAFTAVSSDGTASKLVTVTITGTNDVPVIGGVSTAVVEDPNAPQLFATGHLTIADVDAGQSAFPEQDFVADNNGYGIFHLAADGEWVYAASAIEYEVHALGAGESITESFTATSIDGSASQVVTVTIPGANDAVTIVDAATTAAISVTEITSGGKGENATTHIGTGTIVFEDQDLTDTHTATVIEETSGYVGSLMLAPVNQDSKTVEWQFQVEDSALNFLQAGDIQEQRYLVSIADGHGSTATQTVVVTLVGADDPKIVLNENPIANPDTAAGYYTDLINIDVLANDTDANGDTLYVAYLVDNPDHGDVLFNEDGTLSYIANSGYVGLDSFTYLVKDGQGGSAVGTVDLTLNDPTKTGPNENPIANPDTAAGYYTDLIHIDVLANDTDANGDTLYVAYLVDNPDHGDVLSNEDGTLSYIANSGYVGLDSFTYLVKDGQGGSAVGTVDLTLNDPTKTGPNENPIANPDTAAGYYTDLINIDVLANDTDANGDTLYVAYLVDNPDHGDVLFNEDGTLSYIANSSGYVGLDSFTYLVKDGQGGSAVGTVDLTLNAPIQPGHDPVGGEVFLRNDYIEIGVSGAGSLGTLNDAPANYHPQDGFTNIAMVVDLDGWDTGDAPRASDITLPEIGMDTVAFMYNGGNVVLGAMMQLQDFATTTTDVSSSTRVAAQTQGFVDGVFPMTQLIELDPGATYFRTTYTLENTTADTLTDVGILRCINADQDYAYGTTLTTNDVLANPTLWNDVAAVRAYGANSGVAIDLVAFDSDVRVSVFGAMNDNPGIGFAYDNPLDPNGTLTGNSINLTMRFGEIAPGEVVSKVFYTSFNGRTDGHDMCIGTDSDDVIDAKGGNDIIVGLAGNDLLTGGAGNDRFVFNPDAGFDTITDFTPATGAGDHDVIELRGYGAPLLDQYGYSVTTFDELMSHASYSNGDTYLDLTPTNQIILKNVAMEQLHAEDFIFG